MFKGGSYFGRQDVVEVANAAYAKYINFNALYGGTIFPSLQQFDREVVGIILSLLDAPEGAGGSLTTGGAISGDILCNFLRLPFRFNRKSSERDFR